MTTFKTGDRVTSPLLVGEWEVNEVYGGMHYISQVDFPHYSLEVPVAHLVPVAPPLPPEPPVGSGVFVDGRLLILGSMFGRWFTPGSKGTFVWADIAGRATPAVPLADVLQALIEYGNEPMPADRIYDTTAERIARLFGGTS